MSGCWGFFPGPTLSYIVDSHSYRLPCAHQLGLLLRPDSASDLQVGGGCEGTVEEGGGGEEEGKGRGKG